MTNPRKGDWLQTASGKQYWVIEPNSVDICLEDIAHHLSLNNRFLGATSAPWPVSAHALLVSHISEEAAPTELKILAALWGLHHDSHEAYLGDPPRPIKRCGLRISDLPWSELEVRTDVAISIALKLPVFSESVRSLVKLADTRALMTEMRDLMATPPKAWNEHAQPWPASVRQDALMPWQEHKSLFLTRHAKLMAKLCP